MPSFPTTTNLTASFTSSEDSFQQPDEEVAGYDSSDEDENHEQQCEATS